MGNEFGHPEWLDFPRDGNGYSHYYCRRQWSLVDNPELQYEYMNEFDKAMIHLIKEHGLLGKKEKYVKHDLDRQVIVYKRGDLLFAFNFHSNNSYSDFKVEGVARGKYRTILSTDSARFGGHERIALDQVYNARKLDTDKIGFEIYLPARCAVVLRIEK